MLVYHSPYFSRTNITKIKTCMCMCIYIYYTYTYVNCIIRHTLPSGNLTSAIEIGHRNWWFFPWNMVDLSILMLLMLVYQRVNMGKPSILGYPPWIFHLHGPIALIPGARPIGIQIERQQQQRHDPRHNASPSGSGISWRCFKTYPLVMSK